MQFSTQLPDQTNNNNNTFSTGSNVAGAILSVIASLPPTKHWIMSVCQIQTAIQQVSSEHNSMVCTLNVN